MKRHANQNVTTMWCRDELILKRIAWFFVTVFHTWSHTAIGAAVGGHSVPCGSWHSRDHLLGRHANKRASYYLDIGCIYGSVCLQRCTGCAHSYLLQASPAKSPAQPCILSGSLPLGMMALGGVGCGILCRPFNQKFDATDISNCGALRMLNCMCTAANVPPAALKRCW